MRTPPLTGGDLETPEPNTHAYIQDSWVTSQQKVCQFNSLYPLPGSVGNHSWLSLNFLFSETAHLDCIEANRQYPCPLRDNYFKIDVVASFLPAFFLYCRHRTWYGRKTICYRSHINSIWLKTGIKIGIKTHASIEWSCLRVLPRIYGDINYWERASLL